MISWQVQFSGSIAKPSSHRIGRRHPPDQLVEAHKITHAVSRAQNHVSEAAAPHDAIANEDGDAVVDALLLVPEPVLLAVEDTLAVPVAFLPGDTLSLRQLKLS